MTRAVMEAGAIQVCLIALAVVGTACTSGNPFVWCSPSADGGGRKVP
jgi:hypothetical protein